MERVCYLDLRPNISGNNVGNTRLIGEPNWHVSYEEIEMLTAALSLEVDVNKCLV